MLERNNAAEDWSPMAAAKDCEAIVPQNDGGERRMYTCDRCGKPTPNFKKYPLGPIHGEEGYSWCDECHKDFLRTRKWEHAQEYTDEVVCPWCGSDIGDSWELDDSGEMECYACGRAFSYERNVEVTYTSKRRLEDMPEGWNGEEPEDD